MQQNSGLLDFGEKKERMQGDLNMEVDQRATVEDLLVVSSESAVWRGRCSTFVLEDRWRPAIREGEQGRVVLVQYIAVAEYALVQCSAVVECAGERLRAQTRARAVLQCLEGQFADNKEVV